MGTLPLEPLYQLRGWFLKEGGPSKLKGKKKKRQPLMCYYGCHNEILPCWSSGNTKVLCRFLIPVLVWGLRLHDKCIMGGSQSSVLTLPCFAVIPALVYPSSVSYFVIKTNSYSFKSRFLSFSFTESKHRCKVMILSRWYDCILQWIVNQ
jgi:hypothetical protein